MFSFFNLLFIKLFLAAAEVEAQADWQLTEADFLGSLYDNIFPIFTLFSSFIVLFLIVYFLYLNFWLS